MQNTSFLAVVIAALLLNCSSAAWADDVPIKRMQLQKTDVPGTAYETTMSTAEFAPAAKLPPHTHPGVETGYVLSGEMLLIVDGNQKKLLKQGDSYLIPANTVHEAYNESSSVAKIIGSWVLLKDKPFSTPAAAPLPTK